MLPKETAVTRVHLLGVQGGRPVSDDAVYLLYVVCVCLLLRCMAVVDLRVFPWANPCLSFQFFLFLKLVYCILKEVILLVLQPFNMFFINILLIFLN